MRNAKVVYCIDGFNGVEIPICSINELLSVLQKIKSEASTVMEIIFSADVVVEGSGRLSCRIKPAAGTKFSNYHRASKTG